MGSARRRLIGLLIVLIALVAIAWSSNRLAVWTGIHRDTSGGSHGWPWVGIGPAPMSILSRRDDPEFFNSGLTSAIAVDPAMRIIG